MSKELIALEDIILYLNANEPKGLYCKNIEIIKNALKDYENAKTRLDDTQTLFWENKRKLKALEIIAKKRVNVEWLFETENVEEYNESLYTDLTQIEYDLLNEVLW